MYAAARHAGMPCEVIHLATRGAIRPIPADVHGLRQELGLLPDQYDELARELMDEHRAR